MPKTIKRALRIAAFTAATAIVGLGAGNLAGQSALESAYFGALIGLMGLASALLIIFAKKGSVPDNDFDRAINDAVEKTTSKDSEDK